MILLPKPSPGDPVVFLFGHGLVGQSVTETLRAGASGGAAARDAHYLTYNWQDSVQRVETRKRLAALIQPGDDVQIVWTAGRAGFGSTAPEMVAETALLDEILEYAAGLTQHAGRVSFDFVSSAGGLFEGMTNVTADTVPQPQRPYGLEKIRQEGRVAQIAASAGITHRIYRLSSIYGYSAKARLGLISALIMNALNGTVTPITGDVDTLRDYVFASDIGAFVVSQLQTGQASAAPFLLASGTSVSVATIIDLVRDRLPEPLLLEYQETATNKAHMSFDPDSLPTGWQPTPLADGIDHTITLLRRHLQV